MEMTEAERIAHDLAVLVAQEHQRAKDEEARRRAAEEAAEELAKLLANDHAALEREREARLRAETEVRELSEWALEDLTPPARPPRRFVLPPHASQYERHPAERTR
jgi:hypothetical protein